MMLEKGDLVVFVGDRAGILVKRGKVKVEE
jgi:hypothetical protein